MLVNLAFTHFFKTLLNFVVVVYSGTCTLRCQVLVVENIDHFAVLISVPNDNGRFHGLHFLDFLLFKKSAMSLTMFLMVCCVLFCSYSFRPNKLEKGISNYNKAQSWKMLGRMYLSYTIVTFCCQQFPRSSKLYHNNTFCSQSTKWMPLLNDGRLT